MTMPDPVVRISLPTPFPVGAANVFVVKRDPVILVDTGPKLEGNLERIAYSLRQQGLTIRNIGIILITHGHLDHIGLLKRLVEESGATTYAHPHAVIRTGRFDEVNHENHAFHLEVMREFGVPEETVAAFAAQDVDLGAYGEQVAIDHAVRDEESIGPLTAYHVPGHSPSDTLYVDHERRFAFTGDHVLKGINPNPLVRKPEAGKERPKSLVEYIASLRRTRELDLERCYPGHGATIYDHRQVIDGLLTRLGERAGRVLRRLEPGKPVTPYEVCQTLFPKLDIRQLTLGLSVAVGHLEWLEERHLAYRNRHNGLLRFERA